MIRIKSLTDWFLFFLDEFYCVFFLWLKIKTKAVFPLWTSFIQTVLFFKGLYTSKYRYLTRSKSKSSWQCWRTPSVCKNDISLQCNHGLALGSVFLVLCWFSFKTEKCSPFGRKCFRQRTTTRYTVWMSYYPREQSLLWLWIRWH